MKCCQTLAQNAVGGYQRKCGQIARFNVKGKPYCRRHASEVVFVTVLEYCGDHIGDILSLRRL